MLFEDPTQHIVALLSSLPFFGVQRGASEASLDSLLRDGSLADLARRSRNSSANACAGAAAAGAATTAAASSASGAEVAALKPPVPAAGPEAAAAAAREAAARASSLLRDAARPLKNVAQGKVMMDQGVLRDALRHLCGDLTFLEAFDRTGRVLNIVVTRSDGRAPPLLCNYLTTPQMVRYTLWPRCAMSSPTNSESASYEGGTGRLLGVARVVLHPRRVRRGRADGKGPPRRPRPVLQDGRTPVAGWRGGQPADLAGGASRHVP